jgi:adenine-specific DNA-methyltransferase
MREVEAAFPFGRADGRPHEVNGCRRSWIGDHARAVIKYLGSKRLLVGAIAAAVEGLGAKSALDLFSGTARVGRALKERGLYVTSNDHLAFAATIARCYVEADARALREPAARLIAELAKVPPRAGYFTESFCVEARYLQPENGARVDAIRDEIAARGLDPVLEAIAVTSLMEAADRVDSTTGVQMAYLKQWAARSHNTLELRVPAMTEGAGRAVQLDALEAAEIEADVAYLDPPYNQHSYLGNYHVWETLARWDAPEKYGIANKRIDCRAYKNPFNSRKKMPETFARVIERVRAKDLIVSFSDEGYLTREEIERMLAARGHVRVVSTDFKRYVGAQIGIFNPQGEKVGQVSHLRNREMLFVVSRDRDRAERAAEMAERALGCDRSSSGHLAP